MTRPSPFETLLHTADAADLLKVSPAWLDRCRWAKKGPTFIRVGGPSGRAVRYRLSDVLSWIDQNRVPAEASNEARGATR